MLNRQDHTCPRGLLPEDHRTVVEDLMTLEHPQVHAALQAEIIVKDCSAKLMPAMDSVVGMPGVGDRIKPVIDGYTASSTSWCQSGPGAITVRGAELPCEWLDLVNGSTDSYLVSTGVL